jgi:hypothetical protein
MKKEILNPNCSEVVWRLQLGDKKTKKIETDTSEIPNKLVDNLIIGINKLAKNKEDIDKIGWYPDYGDGPEGDMEREEYIEYIFDITKRVAKGEITKAWGKKLAVKHWDYIL